ncbi:hypothetical protein CK203_105498 [Vitis vinifera]|uniref:Uncharacterized protein n=1 Tax=Vitis vinifera TaxID=29760 RepID=A0A438EHB6_VITVI|nr:hypothetical protein CK203_105498 [Vitis vinifera]
MFSAPEKSSHFDAPHLPQHYDGSAMFYGIRLHHPLPSLDIAVAPRSNIHDRKNAQGILGNFHYFNGFASSSSSAPPFNTRHLEFGVPVMDSASLAFAQPQYRGNNAPSIMEVGSHRSVRNRSGAVGPDSVLAHNHYHLVQGNHIGHPFQPSGNPWVDQQSGNNGSGGGTLAWNHGLALPYLHGSNISGGSREAGNVGIQGYHDTSSGRSSTDYLQPPVLHRHHNLHYPPPPPPHLCKEQEDISTLKHPGPVPPTWIRIDRSHQGGVAPEATSRHGNLPYLRTLPEEEVAILDLSASYQVGEGASMDQEKDSCIICQEEYENEEKIGFLIVGMSTMQIA